MTNAKYSLNTFHSIIIYSVKLKKFSLLEKLSLQNISKQKINVYIVVKPRTFFHLALRLTMIENTFIVIISSKVNCYKLTINRTARIKVSEWNGSLKTIIYVRTGYYYDNYTDFYNFFISRLLLYFEIYMILCLVYKTKNAVIKNKIIQKKNVNASSENLIQVALILPISSVNHERSFFFTNPIKTWVAQRSRSIYKSL